MSQQTLTPSENTTTETPLRVESLRKEFGGITAVADTSFAVEKGSLTGLIGPNGAGKSTTFNCITGVYTPTAGRVYFDDTDITTDSPHEIAQQGLVRTFQIARELSEMTVMENMMLSPKHQQGESLLRSVLPGLREAVIKEEEKIASGSGRYLSSSKLTTWPVSTQGISLVGRQNYSKWPVRS